MFTGIIEELDTINVRPGDAVNIELDILAKHVERLLDPYRP